MLYDKKWDAKKVEAPAPDPLSLDGLIAWLRTMPAGGAYNFDSCQDCLGAHFAIAVSGIKDPIQALIKYNTGYREIFGGWDEYAEVALEKPWTYSAALGRALAYRQRNPHAGRAG